MASKGKVLVAMSGGVDSSVAAKLLLEEGYEVCGATMSLYCDDSDFAFRSNAASNTDTVLNSNVGHIPNTTVPPATNPGLASASANAPTPDTTTTPTTTPTLVPAIATTSASCTDFGSSSKKASCCSLDDIEDARRVCALLGIRHYVFNFKDAFQKQVIDDFCSAYLKGLTPNPCIDCNRYLKFGLFQQKRKELGFDFAATGHYARRVKIECGNENDLSAVSTEFESRQCFELHRGIDPLKDQSYVLYHLNSDTLKHMLFPLGELTKAQVRQIALDMGFENAEKEESQDICFISDDDYVSFIENRTKNKLAHGDILNMNGEKIGEHLGLARYTIGQRKGLNLGGGMDPMYVISKDPTTNTITVGPAEALLVTRMRAHDVNVTADAQIKVGQKVLAKANYRAKAALGHLSLLEEDKMEVCFDESIRASSPGQSLVVYSADGDTVLAGGILE